MHKFRTIVPYNLNVKVWDECAADTDINFATEFSSFAREQSGVGRGKN